VVTAAGTGITKCRGVRCGRKPAPGGLNTISTMVVPASIRPKSMPTIVTADILLSRREGMPVVDTSQLLFVRAAGGGTGHARVARAQGRCDACAR